MAQLNEKRKGTTVIIRGIRKTYNKDIGDGIN
jgi:hypothetical protein